MHTRKSITMTHKNFAVSVLGSIVRQVLRGNCRIYASVLLLNTLLFRITNPKILCNWTQREREREREREVNTEVSIDFTDGDGTRLRKRRHVKLCRSGSRGRYGFCFPVRAGGGVLSIEGKLKGDWFSAWFPEFDSWDQKLPSRRVPAIRFFKLLLSKPCLGKFQI
jgi:hypothetical protein